MGRVNFYGKMTVVIKDSFLRTIYMDLGSMCGRMDGCMRESGRITRWKGRDFLLGWMEGNIKVSIKMIRSKDLGCLPSEMVEFIRGSGKMGNNMEKVYLGRKMLLGKGYGKMGRELIG